VHSPDDELPPPNPSGDWSPQDMRDLYSAFGWIGTGGLGLMLAVTVAFVPEPAHWWHIPIATTAAVMSLIPWLGAAGTLRYLHRTHARARHRSVDVFRGGH